MAHFSKIGTGNIVEQVVVVSNDIATTEQAGIEFLQKLFNNRDVWKQTSYNTRGGEHLLDGTPFRKNYGAVGFKYDQSRDAFIPPKPYNSWILNETTCLWEAPIPMPELTQEQIDNKSGYKWNEENQSWDFIE
jgi:hypothetical protein